MTDLQKIEKKLDRLLNKPKPKSWVQVKYIQKLTGWGGEEMRQAREDGVIEYKSAEKGFLYNLDSLHPALMKNKNI